MARCSSAAYTLPELYAKRERASSKRTFSIVGVSLGVAAAIGGGVLLAHGADVRSRESSADGEEGLGSLLTGLLFATGGVTLAVGSGVSLVEARRDLSEIDARIRASTSDARR